MCCVRSAPVLLPLLLKVHRNLFKDIMLLLLRLLVVVARVACRHVASCN
jgi:hypothetical protein